MRIIAHRGANLLRPENTIAAFEEAVHAGVDAIEADVLISRDGMCVIRHDDIIEFNGGLHYVKELSFEELQSIDLGQGMRILSLTQFLDEFAKRVPLVLDIKGFGVAKNLSADIDRYALDRIQISSFLFSEIRAVRRIHPNIDIAIAMAAVPVDFENIFKQADTRKISIFRGYLSESVFKLLRDEGAQVAAYPVNFLREAQIFASWGVSAIFTDDPASMQELRTK